MTSIEIANMYNKYGMTAKAKETYLEVLMSDEESSKAEAYYRLGTLVHEEGKLSLALETWNELVKKYPDTKYAKFVSKKVKVLTEAVLEAGSKEIKNTIAKTYLNNGDFWSKGKSNTFRIDSSWIGNVEAANFWYDKTIEEFPGTSAAEEAYISILKTILGWEEGPYASYGIEADYSSYMPQLVNTFLEFEKGFPNSTTLQAFRFQIAQEYWKHKDWDNTRLWLNKIIDSADSDDSFYKDLAQRRLASVEY